MQSRSKEIYQVRGQVRDQVRQARGRVRWQVRNQVDQVRGRVRERVWVQVYDEVAHDRHD